MNYPKSTKAGQFFWAIIAMALFAASYEYEHNEQENLIKNCWYGE